MLAMTKCRLLRWSLLLAIFAAFAVWLEPTRVVWGWLRGEAFYQGRPTSYWRDEISRWNVNLNYHTGGYRYGREFTSCERFLSKRMQLPPKKWPELLDGDRNGMAVLKALEYDRSDVVRDWARIGLERIAKTDHDSIYEVPKGLSMPWKDRPFP
jgi:hypothetical protein